MKEMTYFFNSDSVYITLLDEDPYTDNQEYQDGVILYRNYENKIVYVEIFGFSVLKENRIKIGENEYFDLTVPFRKLRMAISLEDIMFAQDEDTKEEFDGICRQWNLEIKLPDLEKMKELEKVRNFSIEVPEIPHIELAEPCY